MSQLIESHSLVGGFTEEAFASHMAGHETPPSWWGEKKRAAYAAFVDLPLPQRTHETWRFSKLSGITLEGISPAPATPAAKYATIDVPATASLAFVNNVLVRQSTLAPELVQKGVVVATLRQALKSHPELLKKHFMAQPQKLGSAKFAALHTAFVEDGAFIYIPRGVEIADPILVAHVAAGGGACFPHTLVIAEENSKATVVDDFVSADGSTNGSRAFACGANDLYAGHGARLTYVAAQNWSAQTLSFQLNSTVVRRDARVQTLNLHLGSYQARHESLSQMQAPGAYSEMLSLTVASREQEFDQRTLQIHQAPNTSSNLLYKNALQDKSKTIFSGLIIVDADAQKTDAYQSNRNLVLSPDAEANSLPGLEIQANDVRCTHGATTSRIQPEQLFYLKARGIPEKEANELLIFGFFEEVLSKLENEPLHLQLAAMVRAKFEKH